MPSPTAAPPASASAALRRRSATGARHEDDDERERDGGRAGARERQHERHRREPEYHDLACRRLAQQRERCDDGQSEAEVTGKLVGALERSRDTGDRVVVEPEPRGRAEHFLREGRDRHETKRERDRDAQHAFVWIEAQGDDDGREQEQVFERLERFAQRRRTEIRVTDGERGREDDEGRADEQRPRALVAQQSDRRVKRVAPQREPDPDREERDLRQRHRRVGDVAVQRERVDEDERRDAERRTPPRGVRDERERAEIYDHRDPIERVLVDRLVDDRMAEQISAPARCGRPRRRVRAVGAPTADCVRPRTEDRAVAP